MCTLRVTDACSKRTHVKRRIDPGGERRARGKRAIAPAAIGYALVVVKPIGVDATIKYDMLS